MSGDRCVRVVIPARGAGSTLYGCVEALQRNLDLEIVVVHDREDTELGLAARFARVRAIRSDGVGAGAARNLGARDFRNGILVFVDADVIVNDHRLERLIAPILGDEADAAVGNYSAAVNDLPFLDAYKQLYIAHVYARREGLIRNEFWTGFGAIRAELFHRLGGFDVRFQCACGEDTELGQRITACGGRIAAVPAAVGKHLHHYTLRSLVANDFRKGVQILLNALRHRNRLDENRHSSKRDVAAVICAGLSLAGILSAAFDPRLALAALAAFGAWMFTRFELLKCFRGQSGLFQARCLPLALLLDLVRGICVIAASGIFLWEKQRRDFATGGPRELAVREQ